MFKNLNKTEELNIDQAPIFSNINKLPIYGSKFININNSHE